MDENQKIRKINWIYTLVYLFLPIVIIVTAFTIYQNTHVIGNLAVFLVMGPLGLAALWWSLGGSFLYKQQQKKMEKELDSIGFVRNQTFSSSGSTVVVDCIHGKIAFLFRWNPFHIYTRPASSITKAWVDDGKGGSGFMTGSSRVSFLFSIDDIKIRVDTFTSNKRWRMDSDYILTGISKADKMVEVLNAAKNTAH